MARSDDDPLDAAVPEVDRFEQEQQADPTVVGAEEWSIPQGRDGAEADRLEQVQDVVGHPDEEYEPDAP